MAEIVVHHLEHSRSLRVLWALEELGLEYRIVEYKRDPRTWRAGPELRAVHPLGKSPVVEIDGVVYAESGAILEHLVDTFGQGRLRPTDPDDLREYRFFLHYAEGSVMTPLMVTLIASRVKRAPVPFFIKPVVKRIGEGIASSYSGPELDLHTRYIDDRLGAAPWFAGAEFSVADIQMSYPCQAIQARRGIDDAPHIADWLERIEERPALQRAIARGGRSVPAKA